MKGEKILLGLLSVLGMANALSYSSRVCPQYLSGKIDQSSSPGTCVKFFSDNTTYLVDYSVCPEDQMCIYDGFFGIDPRSDVVCKEEPVPQKQVKFPGEKCGVDSDCSEIYAPFGCQNGICQGYSEGQAFKNVTNKTNYACNPGLFYNGTTDWCVKQVGNEEACKSDWECVNSHVCIDSKCTEIGSVTNGTQINIPH